MVNPRMRREFRTSLTHQGKPDPTAAGHGQPDARRAAPVGTRLQLRVLETSDLHMNILPYDYFADRPCDARGLARTATLIAAARAEVANCLLLDNGDFLQGNPLADHVARTCQGRETPNPMIASMNHLGYDAGTLGNHEFNYGLPVLERALRDAAFPLVSANVARAIGADPLGDDTFVPPWVLLDRRLRDAQGREFLFRIGVIGFVPPQISDWDRDHLDGRIVTRDIVQAARAHVPALRAAGADLVIALAHTGIGAPGAANRGEQDALELAGIAGIDVLLCGHSHLSFPSTQVPMTPGIDPDRGAIGGKPALMPGFWGSHLGVLDLDLVQDAGGWRVADFRGQLRPISTRGPDGVARATTPACPRITALAQAAHDETLAELRRPVGRTAAPIHSFFALVAPDAALTLVAQAQTAHVAQRLAGHPEAALPLLSAVAPFKCGGRGGPDFFIDIPAGPLLRSHVSDLYIYPNTISAVAVSGADLAEWLERAAGLFCQITPGQTDQPLIDPDFPSYNFDVIAGLSYQIDLTAPARYAPDGRLANPQARRIRALCHQGRPVAPGARFVVATNNFRTAGAGHFPGATGPALDLGRPLPVASALLAEIARRGTVTPSAAPIWRFAPVAGATAVFDTSRHAATVPLPSGRFDLLRDAPAPAGFARFRLHL